MNTDIRKSICRRCEEQCAVRTTIDHSNPQARCPLGRWMQATWREENQGAAAAIGPIQRLTGIRIGDAVERLVKPVAAAVRSPCLDAAKRLKPDSPCGNMRDKMNKW